MTLPKEQKNDIQLEERIAALSENFRHWNWDPLVPGIIAQWGEFHCTDRTFSLIIKRGDGLTTRVDLLEANSPSRESLIRIICQLDEDANLIIDRLPVEEITYDGVVPGVWIAGIVKTPDGGSNNPTLRIGKDGRLGHFDL